MFVFVYLHIHVKWSAENVISINLVIFNDNFTIATFIYLLTVWWSWGCSKLYCCSPLLRVWLFVHDWILHMFWPQFQKWYPQEWCQLYIVGVEDEKRTWKILSVLLSSFSPCILSIMLTKPYIHNTPLPMHTKILVPLYTHVKQDWFSHEQTVYFFLCTNETKLEMVLFTFITVWVTMHQSLKIWPHSHHFHP